MKTCRHCGGEFDLSSFYKHERMADGYLNICKICVKQRVKKHRINNIDAHRKYDRQRNKQPKRQQHLVELRASVTPKQRKANTAVGNAIRDGRLVRPSFCSNCNVECIPDGHHFDYDKPLEVWWLCRSCHIKVHQLRSDNKR